MSDLENNRATRSPKRGLSITLSYIALAVVVAVSICPNHTLWEGSAAPAKVSTQSVDDVAVIYTQALKASQRDQQGSCRELLKHYREAASQLSDDTRLVLQTLGLPDSLDQWPDTYLDWTCQQAADMEDTSFNTNAPGVYNLKYWYFLATERATKGEGNCQEAIDNYRRLFDSSSPEQRIIVGNAGLPALPNELRNINPCTTAPAPQQSQQPSKPKTFEV